MRAKAGLGTSVFAEVDRPAAVLVFCAMTPAVAHAAQAAASARTIPNLVGFASHVMACLFEVFVMPPGQWPVRWLAYQGAAAPGLYSAIPQPAKLKAQWEAGLPCQCFRTHAAPRQPPAPWTG